MLNKIKTWIIKKLGGYTPTEYNGLKNEISITNTINNRFVTHREIKTLRFSSSLPEYVERRDFDVRKYAFANMVDKIIESGALHVSEFPNPRLCCIDYEVTLKIVV